jgi:ubiquitin-protein ligase E3 C
MFPTFSGNSRRPRNVNMSGQKNLNPFAATSWTPNSSSTASKTVADAQAERNKRQHEREKLKAAQSIQKTWRGHATRRCLKDQRREALDALYNDLSVTDPLTRTAEALPLVVTALDPRRSDDRGRLDRFVQDLLHCDCSLVKSQQTASGSQIRRLTRQLLVLLQKYVAPHVQYLIPGYPCLTFISSSGYEHVPPAHLQVLIQILSTRYDSARDSLESHFDIIANYCRNEEIRDAESLSLLEKAILVPIAKDQDRHASNAFALCFLSQPNLKLFESNVGAFAERIDMEMVSVSIVEAYAAGWASKQQAETRLWLLAHFIALGNATRDSSLGPSYLHALYIQLSSLHIELKKYQVGHAATDSATSKKRLPPFIEQAIQSLVEKDEITHVLERFTRWVHPQKLSFMACSFSRLTESQQFRRVFTRGI